MVGAEGGGAESINAAPDCREKPITSVSSPGMGGVGATAMTASNTRAWIAKIVGLLLIVISWAGIFERLASRKAAARGAL